MDMNGRFLTEFWAKLFQKGIKAWLLLLIATLPLANTLAHGSLHEAIQRKSQQIKENPQDAMLLFERGILYQEHGDIGLALGDFQKVLELEPAYDVCHLPLAQLYRDTGALEQAIMHINYFIKQEPGNPFGYETRASVYRMMGAPLQMVADLRQMITLKNDNAIRPEDYFQLADGILMAHPGQYAPAIEALEEGLQRLGDIISIQSRLIDLEIAGQRYSSALNHIEQAMKPLARKDRWIAKKAEVLKLMEQRPVVNPILIGKENGHGPNASFSVPAAVLSVSGDSPVSSTLMLINVIRGPYLQSGTPTSMIIKWRTSTATNSKVWYGPNPASLTQTMQESGARTNHEIKLTGLAPNTRYYYAIGDNSGILAGGTPNHFFQTSPPTGAVQPVRAWVLGDCGTGDNHARAVRDGYYTYAGDNMTDLIMLLGDNAYDSGKDSEYQTALFENMYEDQLIHSVLWSTPGNHDYGSASASSQTGPYYDIFTFPKNGEAGGLASGTEAYYSFDYANIHFVTLDSHDSGRDPGDPMLVWLENDLQSTQQDWIIAIFHHPPYSKGSHDSDNNSQLTDMRENVLPILEAAGVDLVLSGHSHSYERSYLLNGHYGFSNSLSPSMILDNGNGRSDDDGVYEKDGFGPAAGKGAVYVVAGSSGKVSDAPLNHPVMYYNALSLGSLSLEVTDKKLDLKFIDVAGDVQDYFTLLKFIPVGTPPVVSVSAPADSAFYPAPQTITLRAQASDSDGQVEAVTFFVNGDSVAVDHTAPFSRNWTPPAEGHYLIQARAKDNDGNLVTSTHVVINVGYIESCSQISSREDDAEEYADGNVSLSSSDLELADDPSNGVQMVGMRFTGLHIPSDAVIIDARIQFTVDDNNDVDPCSLSIHGQDSDNASPFSGSDFDISSRPLTQASVNWAPPRWPDVDVAGQDQQTPNLAPILQEIVGRDGFSSSSAIAFIIEGQGRRTAKSYDGLAYAAPQLCVKYAFCQPSNLQASSSADNICAGQAVTLSAGPAASYLWNTGETGAQISVQPAETTTYSLTAWDENGCLATDEVTVNVLPPPQVSFEVDTVFFCAGQGVKVSSPGGFAEYRWSNGQATPTVFIQTPGTWSLTVTDANGCTASASLEASERPPLNLQASSSANNICAGQSVMLSASPAASYQWSTGGTSAQINVQPSETTTYSLTAWAAFGCAATTEVTVEVLPLPSFEIIQNESELKVVGLDDITQYTFLWNTGATSPAIIPESIGQYCVTVTDTDGCSSEACYDFLATGITAAFSSALWDVFPNPFENQAHIRPVQAPDNLQIEVFSLLGQPVPFRRRIDGEEIILEFQNLPSGVYTVAISNGEAIRVVKILKQ